MAISKQSPVDTYIAKSPKESQKTLKEIREILRSVAPNATEVIKWGYPCWEEKRILFSVAAHKSHLNFMPTHSSLEPFKEELKEFKTGKDTIQFPYDKPLPKTLIKKIAKYRRNDVVENDAKWMS